MSILESLQEQNYSQPQNKRTQWKVFRDSNIALRRIDPNDRKDMGRYLEVDSFPEVKDFVAYVEETTEEENFEIVRNEDFSRLVYAASGSRPWNMEHTNVIQQFPKEELGELQAIIQFSEEEQARVDELTKKGMIEFDHNKIYLETSYTRYYNPNEGFENRIKGIVTNSLAQAVYAVCVTLNTPTTQNVQFHAYVSERNTGSIKILEKCAFKRMGKIFYDEDSEEEDLFYVLDWEGLISKLLC